MNATLEKFSDHSGTSTHDIAFLTISDVSNQMGISKSKLYKDIRDGRLIAEKSLDETLVVSPRALQNAYEKFDFAVMFEPDLPSPDCLERLDESLSEQGLPEPTIAERPSENAGKTVENSIVEAAGIVDNGPSEKGARSAGYQTEKRGLTRKTKLIGLCTGVIFCSAILISVLRNF